MVEVLSSEEPVIGLQCFSDNTMLCAKVTSTNTTSKDGLRRPRSLHVVMHVMMSLSGKQAIDTYAETETSRKDTEIVDIASNRVFDRIQ